VSARKRPGARATGLRDRSAPMRAAGPEEFACGSIAADLQKVRE